MFSMVADGAASGLHTGVVFGGVGLRMWLVVLDAGGGGDVGGISEGEEPVLILGYFDGEGLLFELLQ
jgi:hypothetical protein